MKKTMQFLVALSIMIEGSNAFAGINTTISTTDKPVANAPVSNTNRGQLYLILTVDDEYGKPVIGATVSAPCTGQKPILTDANGSAVFTLNGPCNCDGAEAEVITSSCDEFIPLKCATVNQATCKD